MKKTAWTIYAYGKKYFIWVVYFLFIVFTIQIIRESPQVGSKIIYGTIGVLAIAFVLYYEYLKRLYSKMINALTIDCDIAKAKTLRQQLKNKDYFKGFTKSILLFDTLLLLDEGNYQECLNHLADNQQFFHGTIDYLAIYYHTKMQCFTFLNQPEPAEEAIKKLKRLKHANSKSSKLSALFSWEEIDAYQFALQGRNKKSLSSLEEVRIEQLNPRELTYYFYEKAEILKKLQKPQEAGIAMKEAKKFGNTLAIVQ